MLSDILTNIFIISGIGLSIVISFYLIIFYIKKIK